jgi:hypothetical protein
VCEKGSLQEYRMVGFDQWGRQRAILTRGCIVRHTLNGVSLWWVVFTSNGGWKGKGTCVCVL